jgi:hypothetical protein
MQLLTPMVVHEFLNLCITVIFTPVNSAGVFAVDELVVLSQYWGENYWCA